MHLLKIEFKMCTFHSAVSFISIAVIWGDSARATVNGTRPSLQGLG